VPEGAAGAQAKWNTAVTWVGGGEWHEYRVFPYWQGEKRIARFRIDFSNPADTLGTYEVDWIRVVDTVAAKSEARAWRSAALGAWRGEDGAAVSVSGDALAVVSQDGQIGRVASPLLVLPARENVFVSVEMAADAGSEAAEGRICAGSAAAQERLRDRRALLSRLAVDREMGAHLAGRAGAQAGPGLV